KAVFAMTQHKLALELQTGWRRGPFGSSPPILWAISPEALWPSAHDFAWRRRASSFFSRFGLLLLAFGELIFRLGDDLSRQEAAVIAEIVCADHQAVEVCRARRCRAEKEQEGKRADKCSYDASGFSSAPSCERLVSHFSGASG